MVRRIPSVGRKWELQLSGSICSKHFLCSPEKPMLVLLWLQWIEQSSLSHCWSVKSPPASAFGVWILKISLETGPPTNRGNCGLQGGCAWNHGNLIFSGHISPCKKKVTCGCPPSEGKGLGCHMHVVTEQEDLILGSHSWLSQHGVRQDCSWQGSGGLAREHHP
jgi:hypothetical protein